MDGYITSLRGLRKSESVPLFKQRTAQWAEQRVIVWLRIVYDTVLDSNQRFVEGNHRADGRQVSAGFDGFRCVFPPNRTTSLEKDVFFFPDSHGNQCVVGAVKM